MDEYIWLLNGTQLSSNDNGRKFQRNTQVLVLQTIRKSESYIFLTENFKRHVQPKQNLIFTKCFKETIKILPITDVKKLLASNSKSNEIIILYKFAIAIFEFLKIKTLCNCMNMYVERKTKNHVNFTFSGMTSDSFIGLLFIGSSMSFFRSFSTQSRVTTLPLFIKKT